MLQRLLRFAGCVAHTSIATLLPNGACRLSTTSLACRVRFAAGPLPGTPDGHPSHEGLTAQQRRVLSMALTPDLTPSNVRLLEQELGEDCQASVTRLKRRWASPAGALLLLCGGGLDPAAADRYASGASPSTPYLVEQANQG